MVYHTFTIHYIYKSMVYHSLPCNDHGISCNSMVGGREREREKWGERGRREEEEKNREKSGGERGGKEG